MSCKAVEDSVVLKLPAVAFLNVFKEYPECMVRIIQVSRIFISLENESIHFHVDFNDTTSTCYIPCSA